MTKFEYLFTIGEEGKKWHDIGSETKRFINIHKAKHYGDVLSGLTGKAVKVQKDGATKFDIQYVDNLEMLLEPSDRKLLKKLKRKLAPPDFYDNDDLLVELHTQNECEISIFTTYFTCETRYAQIDKKLSDLIFRIIDVYYVKQLKNKHIRFFCLKYIDYIYNIF